jgi:choline dehydrogenase-like flavoprotein
MRRKDSARAATNRHGHGDYAFIIIGSGAGGGTLAYDLARSDKKILLIERGPFVWREKIETRAQSTPKVNTTEELWRNVDGSELYPHANYYLSDDQKNDGSDRLTDERD